MSDAAFDEIFNNSFASSSQALLSSYMGWTPYTAFCSLQTYSCYSFTGLGERRHLDRFWGLKQVDGVGLLHPSGVGDPEFASSIRKKKPRPKKDLWQRLKCPKRKTNSQPTFILELPSVVYRKPTFTGPGAIEITTTYRCR